MTFLQRINSNFQWYLSQFKQHIALPLLDKCPDTIKIMFLQEDFIFDELMKRSIGSQDGYAVATLNLGVYKQHFLVATGNEELMNKIARHGEAPADSPEADPEARTPFKPIRQLFNGIPLIVNQMGKDVVAERKEIRTLFADSLMPIWEISHAELKRFTQSESIDLNREVHLMCTRILASVLCKLPPETIQAEFSDLLEEAEHAAFEQHKMSHRKFDDIRQRVKRWNDEIADQNKDTLLSTRNLVRFLAESKADPQDPKSAHAIGGLMAGNNLSALMSSAILEIMTRPDIIQKLRDAILPLGELKPTKESYEKLKNVKYLHQVYLEALRWATPVSVVPRNVSKETQWGDITVKPNTLVFLSMRHAAFDQKQWGEDVKQFNPERFKEPFITPNRFPLIPFSTGPRICPAQFAFVEQVFKQVVANMVLHYQFTLQAPQQVETLPFFEKEIRLHNRYLVAVQKQDEAVKAKPALRRSERILELQSKTYISSAVYSQRGESDKKTGFNRVDNDGQAKVSTSAASPHPLTSGPSASVEVPPIVEVAGTITDTNPKTKRRVNFKVN